MPRSYPKIKLCGIRRLQDIEVMLEGEVPDYIGFIFAPSKRQIPSGEAKIIQQTLKSVHKDVQGVGVFVNETIEKIVSIVDEVELNIVQLHGDEDQGYIDELYTRIPHIQIWKAIRVRSEKDLQRISEIACDYILLDAYHKDSYGGTGQRIERNLLKDIGKYYQGKYFLAGGITYEGLQELGKNVMPYGLDISSGIEVNGYKEREKITKIIKGIREEIVWTDQDALENLVDNIYQKL